MSHVITHFLVPTVNTQDTHSYSLLTFTHTLYLHTDIAVFVKKVFQNEIGLNPAAAKE
jgi:hypothetical protein